MSGFDPGVGFALHTVTLHRWCRVEAFSIHGLPAGYTVEWINDTREGGKLVLGVEFRITESGGDVVGSMRMIQRERRLHLWHLGVSVDYRGRGVGTLLLDIFKEFAEQCAIELISGRIANHGTKRFLIENGFPKQELEEITLTVGVNEPFQTVAIGAGNAEKNEYAARIIDTFEGFPIEKME